MELVTRSGVHGKSPSMILPFDRNSVGAPKETPIICPAHPPRILSSRFCNEIFRGAPCLACQAPPARTASSTIAHTLFLRCMTPLFHHSTAERPVPMSGYHVVV